MNTSVATTTCYPADYVAPLVFDPPWSVTASHWYESAPGPQYPRPGAMAFNPCGVINPSPPPANEFIVGYVPSVDYTTADMADARCRTSQFPIREPRTVSCESVAQSACEPFQICVGGRCQNPNFTGQAS